MFALFDDRKTHPAFLKADPTTSSTKFDKFVKVFFVCSFFLSGADLGRQWGEDNLKLQMFGHMILGEKKHYKRHLRIVYIYVLKKLSIEINFSLFSFTVSKAHVTTLSAWGRTRIYAEGAGRKSDLDQGSETRYFSLRSFHEML